MRSHREDPPSGQRDEGVAVCPAYLQAVGEQFGRVAAWAMDGAAFQIADQASADAGLFRQLLLSQVSGATKVLQMVAEGQERRLFPGILK